MSSRGSGTIPIRHTLDGIVARGELSVPIAEESARCLLQDAVARLRGVRIRERGGVWSGTFGSRGGLLQFALTVTLIASGPSASTVAYELRRTASLRRETLYASLLASLIGIPVAQLWRRGSDLIERQLVREILPALLRAVADGAEREPAYR